MRTSHKRTHTQARQFWLRLLVFILLVGGLVLVGKMGRWSAAADGFTEANAKLKQARSQFEANPTKDNARELQAVLGAYKAVLTRTPAVPVQEMPAPVEVPAVAFATTPPLTEIAPLPPPPGPNKLPRRGKNEQNEIPLRSRVAGATASPDGALQANVVPSQNVVTNPILNFDGIDLDEQTDVIAAFGGRFAPSDTNSDIGPNHIVQTVNSSFRVFSKSTGAPLINTMPLSNLFLGLPAPCNNINTATDGDPIVLYDPLADRWLISEFCLTVTNGSTHQLIAISQTGDPTGAYFAYDFLIPPGRLNDYPHFGVWPDAYYMTTNDFNFAGTAFLGSSYFAFNRAKLLAGDPTANGVAFVFNFGTPLGNGGFLPTDLDGIVLPLAGTPNLSMAFLATEFGDPIDGLRIAEIRPNFTTPANSTITQLADFPVAAFDPVGAVNQPPPGTNLDTLGDRLMHRIAYRTLAGGVQSIVLNWTVNVGTAGGTTVATTQAGIRWMELRRNAGTGAITTNQEATYAPGGGNPATGRDIWMGSVAQDGEGNIGLGFSATQVSGPATNPQVVYTGRLVGDAANMLTGPERVAITSPNPQSPSTRWGDYHSMAVDPVDECTFLFNGHYFEGDNTGTNDWQTRLVTFKVNPTCVTAPKATITGIATAAADGSPLSGVSVTTPEGYFRSTVANGGYSMIVAPGTYSVSCSKTGAVTQTGSVTVAANGTATFNCALQGAPVVELNAAGIAAESCSTDALFAPGETITVTLNFRNVGLAPTNNLIVTLAGTGGVQTAVAQNYGAIPINGNASRDFTFRVNPAAVCGSNVTLTFNAVDGSGATFGPFTFTNPSGTMSFGAPFFAQNFDGVTAPALPAGWTTATTDTRTTGQLPPWVSSTVTPDTAPNAVFSPDVAGNGTIGFINEIVTPVIAVPASTGRARLNFRNLFNLETNFDGGVLEIKIGTGAFADIVVAGGTFVAGGYNGTISTAFGSPIGGRMAWTGLSAGTTAAPAYITSTVDLPAAANGQNIQLRWRCGVDDTVIAGGVAGWRVDTIAIQQGAFTCCTQVTPTVTLTDPAVCTGPGGIVAVSAAVGNPANFPQTGTFTAVLPADLPAITNTCAATIAGVASGTFTACSGTSVVWTGTIPAGGTVNITYNTQVGAVVSGAQLCINSTAIFGPVGGTPNNPLAVQACTTISCPQAGPGGLADTRSPVSDQKPGSVLIYNIYTSTVGSNTQNTRIALTNTHQQFTSFVHLFFIDGASCSVADAYICLTPNQTASFLASDLDPGTTGYLIAVASNRQGCPINFNYLIGEEYVKFSSGHAANLPAESISAIAGGLTPCDGNSVTADLRFDGVSYNVLPRVLALDSLNSRADGNDTLLIINAVGGDLRTFATTLRPIFGLLYDDAEAGVSWTLISGTCQFRSSLTNNFPRTTPRFDNFIPGGRTGWMKFFVNNADPSVQAILGAAINFNSNATATAGAFNQGHNLHKLTNVFPASVVNADGSVSRTQIRIPIVPATCQ